MEQLKKALQSALSLPDSALPKEAPDPLSALPDPLASAWGQLLKQGIDLPSSPTIGQLRARSDAWGKELKRAGRNREADALARARDAYEKEREKRAWALAKERFEALALPERAWRAIKQEGGQAEKILSKLSSKKAEELKGAGADRVRDALLAN